MGLSDLLTGSYYKYAIAAAIGIGSTVLLGKQKIKLTSDKIAKDIEKEKKRFSSEQQDAAQIVLPCLLFLRKFFSFEDENQRIIQAEQMLREVSQDVRLSDSAQPTDDRLAIESEPSSPHQIETSRSPPPYHDWKLKNETFDCLELYSPIEEEEALDYESAIHRLKSCLDEIDGIDIDANNGEGESDNQVSTTSQSQSQSLTTQSSTSLTIASQSFSENRVNTLPSSQLTQLTQATDAYFSQFSDGRSFSQSISQSTENGRQFLNIVVRVPINSPDDKYPPLLSYPTQYSSDSSSPSTSYTSLIYGSPFSNQPLVSSPTPKCCRKHEKYIKNQARIGHQSGKYLSSPKVAKIEVNLDRMFDRMANGNYLKPKYSHNLLCALSIYSNEEQMIEVSEIYKFLCDSFPYFRKANNHWKNSLRHSLATCNWFLKSNVHRTFKKGYKWTLNKETSECLEWEIKKQCIKDLRKLYHCLRDGGKMILMGENFGDSSRGDAKILSFTIPEVLGLLQRMGLVDLSNCSLSSQNSLASSTFEYSQDKIRQDVSSQDHELEP
ncbi:uncharacterized protein LOC141857653 [Brevipalpus obovatus]|uniref:uncharacterized protein LOC141857653 n=1 Tax=Brevipalpus obovatus TaxID=246614 RepID=UPI003D9DD65F